MSRPPKTRQQWAQDEDEKLIHFKTEYPSLPWGEIIKLAKLDRDVKSCSHRWNNYLRFEFDKGKFSPEEDEQIINLRHLGVSWASMAKNDLRGRAANAIKNRWNNHLKKRPATISDPRRYLLYQEEHLMDDEASDHSVRRDDLEAWIAELTSLIPKVDPNETSDHSVWGDDPEALMAEFDSLIPNVDPNAIRSIPGPTS